MEISLAKTFLAITQTGSFVNAAQRMNVTQSTVSLRVKTLEEQLGKALFERSKSGAVLTPAGEQFEKHALTLVRVWSQAQLEVGLSDMHRDHLAVGGEISLWEGFLIPWIGWLRSNISDIAVSASTGFSAAMTQRLVDGTLDLAVIYRPEQRPGIVIEHLFDEELVLVTSGEPKGRSPGADYVFVNWGPEFEADHARAYPNLDYTGLNLDLGSIGIDYLLHETASGYFPLRIVKPLIRRRRLKAIKRARRFVYPVCVAYPEERDEEAYAPILEGLRLLAEGV
jgi:DNA-binding transcriptional LysR family regulator